MGVRTRAEDRVYGLKLVRADDRTMFRIRAEDGVGAMIVVDGVRGTCKDTGLRMNFGVTCSI